jgi:hypothetical protein
MDPRPCHLDLARNGRLSRADKSIRHIAPSLDAFSATAAERAPATSHPRRLFASQIAIYVNLPGCL